MQVLTGRLTADAKVTTVKDDRQVVNFSLALNNNYTTKDGQRNERTTYVECAYWLNTGVAQYLKKGGIVEVAGHLSVDAYTNQQGEAKGVVRFHVNSIQLHSSGKPAANPAPAEPPKKGGKKKQPVTAEEVTEPVEDLPF